MIVVENAMSRLLASACTSPLARPTSAGLMGMNVPMRPSIGPTRTSSRVRSSRLLA